MTRFKGHKHNFNQRVCARMGAAILSLRAAHSRLQRSRDMLGEFFERESIDSEIPPEIRREMADFYQLINSIKLMEENLTKWIKNKDYLTVKYKSEYLSSPPTGVDTAREV